MYYSVATVAAAPPVLFDTCTFISQYCALGLLPLPVDSSHGQRQRVTAIFCDELSKCEKTPCDELTKFV